MICITKRSLVWTFTLLFSGLVIFQTWYSVQWVFTSTDHTSTQTPSPNSTSSSVATSSTVPIHTPSTSYARYKRDYTTLVAYVISLCVIYCLLLTNLRQRRFSPTGNTTPCNTEQDQQVLEQQQQQQQQYIANKRPSSLYLLWRRWWHYELRCCNITFCVGTYAILLGLAGIHGLLVAWPLLNSRSTMDDKHLQQQLLSNRMAQLAIVDIAAAVGLSVRTSGVWQWIGLHNGSSTLPWHRWFSRLGIFCIIYHACFQWTKHYYQHYLANYQTQLQQSHYSSSDNGLYKEMMMSSATITWWDLLVWNSRYLTGNLMLLCLLVLCLGSHPLVRDKWYSLFRLTHGLAFLGLVVLGMWHHWTFAIFYMAVVGLWLLDLVSRWRSSQLVPILALDVVTKGVVRLQVGMERPPSSCHCDHRRHHHSRLYLPGQYVFCSFSGIKWKDVWWSHPFSISKIEYLEGTGTTGTGESQILTFYIKASGKQTKRLVDVADIKEKWPVVRLGAPLGYTFAYSHWTDFYGLYPVVVLVAEGIGITPWMAVIQTLLNGSGHNDYHETITEHVHLVWTARDVAMVQALQKDIQAMVAKVETGLFHLEWHIYITGEEACQQQPEGVIPSSSSPACLQSPRRQYMHSQRGRPDYPALLESIRTKHGDKDVALGICAHEESVQVCGNVARSTRFSHSNAYWNVKSERFDL